MAGLVSQASPALHGLIAYFPDLDTSPDRNQVIVIRPTIRFPANGGCSIGMLFLRIRPLFERG